MEGDAPIWEYGRSPVREGVGTAMHTDHTVARTRKRNWPNPKDERRPGDRRGRELQVVASTTVSPESNTGRESADAHSSGARPRPPVGPRHPRAIRHTRTRGGCWRVQLQAGGGGTIRESRDHRPSSTLNTPRQTRRSHPLSPRYTEDCVTRLNECTLAPSSTLQAYIPRTGTACERL